MFILLLCAKPIFILLYSERWIDSVPYFQFLCLSGLAFCLQGINNQSIAAIGKSKVMFKWTVIKRLVGFIMIFGSIYFFGMKGLLICLVFTTWFSYFVNIGLVSKYVGYKWTRQIADISPILIVSLLIFAVCLLVGQYANLSLYLDGILKFVCFVSIYLSWTLIFKPESYISIKKVVVSIYNKKKHNNKSCVRNF